MRTRLGVGLLVLGFAAFAETRAQAQRQTDLLGELATDLLSRTAVRKEIGLTDRQYAEVEKLRAESAGKRAMLYESRNEILKAVRPNPDHPAPLPETDQETHARLREISDQLAAIMRDYQKQIRATLKPEQARRLIGINVHRHGPEAFDDPGVLRLLNIDEAKREEIQGILNQHRQNSAQASSRLQVEFSSLSRRKPDGSPDGVQVRKAMANDPDYRKKANEFRARFRDESTARNTAAVNRILKVLTKRQRETYLKLIGDPVDPNLYFGPSNPASEAPPPAAKPSAPAPSVK